MKKFRVGDPLQASWEHDGTDVDYWEARLDTAPPVTLPVQPGAVHRWPLPAVPVGSHTVTVRGCNAIECGASTREDFDVAPVIPGAPHHLKFGASEVLLDLPQAAQLVQAYVCIAGSPPLTDRQLQALAGTFAATGLRPTRGNVLAFLDHEYGQL